MGVHPLYTAIPYQLPAILTGIIEVTPERLLGSIAHEYGVWKPHLPFKSSIGKYGLGSMGYPTRSELQQIIDTKQSYSASVETFLFIYDYEQ